MIFDMLTIAVLLNFNLVTAMKTRYLIYGLVLTFSLLIFGCSKTEKQVKTVLKFQPVDSTLVISLKNNSGQKLYFPLDSNFVFDSKVFFIESDGLLTSWGEDLLLTMLDHYKGYDDFKFIEDSGITLLKRSASFQLTSSYSMALDSTYIYELNKMFSPEYQGPGYLKHFKYLKTAHDKSLLPADSSSFTNSEESVYQRHLEFMKNKRVYYLNPGDEVENKICIADWLEYISRERSNQNYNQIALVYDQKFTGNTYGFGLKYPARVLDYKIFHGKLKSDTIFVRLKH
jgi:hypothetical protein